MIAGLERLFTKTDITWKRLILLSAVCGIVPGLLMVPKIFRGTSLQQPGISFEFWVCMALFVAQNCEKPLEAGTKTFAFFLISQPLIYLVQVPFCWLHWQIFAYYPEWAVITLFTFPGGMLAWYTKKGNWLSVCLLSVVNFILCISLAASVHMMLGSFPRYLISSLFIMGELALFPLILFKRKPVRLLAFVLIGAMLLLGSWYEYHLTASPDATFATDLEGTPPFEVQSAYDGVEIQIDGSELSVSVKSYGSFPIYIKDAEGKVWEVDFTYSEKGASWVHNEPD